MQVGDRVLTLWCDAQDEREARRLFCKRHLLEPGCENAIRVEKVGRRA